MENATRWAESSRDKDQRRSKTIENLGRRCDDDFKGETIGVDACSSLSWSCIEDVGEVWAKEQVLGISLIKSS